jgi:hypothetical protein
MIDTAKTYGLLILAALCVTLGLSTWHYKTRANALSFALDTQNKAIKAQNEEANRKYVFLTKQRDAAYLQQEEADENAKHVIDGLRTDLSTRPIGVRYVASPARGCSGSAPEKAVDPGQGNAEAATGVLDAKASLRLKLSLNEIENLQAAFNSCKED